MLSIHNFSVQGTQAHFNCGRECSDPLRDFVGKVASALIGVRQQSTLNKFTIL